MHFAPFIRGTSKLNSICDICISQPNYLLTLHFDWPWIIQIIGIQLCWISSENPSWEFFGEDLSSCFQNKEFTLHLGHYFSSRTPTHLTSSSMSFPRSSEKDVLGHGSHPASIDVEACRFPLCTYCSVTQAPDRVHNCMFLSIRSCRMPFECHFTWKQDR